MNTAKLTIIDEQKAAHSAQATRPADSPAPAQPHLPAAGDTPTNNAPQTATDKLHEVYRLLVLSGR